ncbi:MAG: LCP family protein [Acidimicrobiales bacterium]|nr:LCP family protein [Acidimicrobiales bacterium]
MKLLLWLIAGLLIGSVAERLLTARSEARRGALGESTPPRRRRKVLRWVVLAVFLMLIAGTVGGYMWANSVFDRIEKVDVSSALSSGSSGTNYLLVGADNGQDGEATREGVEGVRSDTIMILNIDGGKARMLSLNRDLWVDNPATGQKGRLNATYNQGPENLIRAVTHNFGIPIDRYIEIDFTSFAGLVDAFGGIDINFEHPAIDRASGLVVEQSGLVHLDGDQALAYVRSRHYTEIIDGKEVPEGGLPDVNRTQRQQAFLRAIMSKAGAKRNPFTLMKAAGNMADGLRIDDDMTMFQAARFAWNMGKLDPETVVLPVVPRTTSGGAAVLELGDGAEQILATFR